MGRINFLHIIILTGAVALTASSCDRDNRNDILGSLTRALSVTIDNSGDEGSREQIRTLRLMVFDDASSENPRLDQNRLVPIDNGPETGTGIIVTELKVSVNEDKLVAAVINEPSGMAPQLAAIKQPWELEAVTYDMVGVINQSGNGDGTISLPMTGAVRNVVVTESNDVDNPMEIAMSVERIASRIDVYLRAEGTAQISLQTGVSTITLDKTYGEGYFAAGTEADGTRDWNIPPAASNFGYLQTVGSSMLSDDSWVCASAKTITPDDGAVFIKGFYVPERTCYAAADADKLVLKFMDISPSGNPVEFVLRSAVREGGSVPEPINIIKRNSIYRISAVASENEIVFEHSIVPWVEEGHEVIIDPQYILKVSTDKIELRNNGVPVTIEVVTDYDREDLGFPKGIILGDRTYYDRYGGLITDTSDPKYGWLATDGGTDGDMSRNMRFWVGSPMTIAEVDCYALVEIKAGNMTKKIKATYVLPPT